MATGSRGPSANPGLLQFGGDRFAVTAKPGVGVKCLIGPMMQANPGLDGVVLWSVGQPETTHRRKVGERRAE